MEVSQETRLTVILRDKSVITGYLQRVGAHSFLVMTPATGSAVQVPYRNVSQIRLWSPDQKTRIIVVSAIAAALVYLVLVIKRF
jgi:hypothetical protein